MTITRTVDKTDLLPRKFIESLDHGVRNIKEIEDWDVRRMIFQNPPSLLMAEYAELSRRHSSVVHAYLWRHPVPVRLLKTRDDGLRCSGGWRLGGGSL